MKIKTIMLYFAFAILSIGVTGCGDASTANPTAPSADTFAMMPVAPRADDTDVKELVIKIFRKHKAGYNSRLVLSAIRVISVNEKIRKTIACAKLSMYVSEAAPPINYEVVYSAQYTTDNQLYVTILEIEIKGN